MTRIDTLRISSLVLACFALFAPMSVNAAEMFFDAPGQLGIGDEFEATIFLNTEDINAVEGTVVFPSDALELTDIRDANSIISLWIEKPKAVSDGHVDFSGIIPGGYHGERAALFSLVFKAKKDGQGAIGVEGARVLLNDGKGTETALSIFPHVYTVSDTPGASTVPVVVDKERPESFAPEIARDPHLLDNQWFVAFTTQDKGSGLERYEVKEVRCRIVGLFTRWTEAESPYVLKDQKLRSTVYVKAIDKTGNERVERIAPQNPLRWYEHVESWVLIVLILSVAIATSTFVWRKSRKP